MNEKALLRKIGNRIKELRLERGMSQLELAVKLDYEKSNMSRLEAGNVNSGIFTYYKVAKALGITLSELLDVE